MSPEKYGGVAGRIDAGRKGWGGTDVDSDRGSLLETYLEERAAPGKFGKTFATSMRVGTAVSGGLSAFPKVCGGGKPAESQFYPGP